MNVSGTWTGEYHFEEGACDKEASAVVGHVVQFEMTLKQGWLGMLSGTVKDDARTGYPEEGQIKGKFKTGKTGGWVEFRRIMPVWRMMHDVGRVTLERWAERRKVVMDTEKAGPALLFEGNLSEDGNEIEGTWKLPGETIMVPGSYLQEPLPTVGGTWRVRRKG